jgi:Bacterial PH domain
MASEQDQTAPGGSRVNGSSAPQAMAGPVPPDPVAPAGAVTAGPVPPGPVPTGPVPPSSGTPGAGRGAGTASRGAGGTTTILKSAWRTTDDGRTIFRLMPPLVLWWVWVAFAAVNVIDLGIQSHTWFAVKVTAVLLVVTGLMYVCTLRPRVISDAAGLTVLNPFRDYRVPWGGVAGVYLGDSVEIQCERPAPKPEKTVYSWALYSPRRSRARAELRSGTGTRKWRQRHDYRAQRRYEIQPGETWEAGANRQTTPSFARMPDKARELASQHPSHVMAAELARRCDAARDAGVAGGPLEGRWAWLPITAVLVPVALLIAVLLAH